MSRDATTDFPAWEVRVGLSRASETAKALGISRQAVDLLRKGERQPSGSTRRLMDLIEHPELIDNLRDGER